MTSGDQTAARDDSDRERLAALGQQVEQLAEHLATTDTQVRALGEQILAVTPGAGEEPGEVAGLTSWLMTTEFTDAHKLIEELRPWLAAVYLRYPDSELPTCWAWHPDVVEELWWLRNAWYDAYTGPKASWQKVGDWHDRQRPSVTRRLAEGLRGGANGRATRCNLSKHLAWADEPAPAAPLTDLLPHVLAAWCSHDRAHWPPTPTAPQLAEAQRYQDEASARRAAHSR